VFHVVARASLVARTGLHLRDQCFDLDHQSEVAFALSQCWAQIEHMRTNAYWNRCASASIEAHMLVKAVLLPVPVVVLQPGQPHPDGGSSNCLPGPRRGLWCPYFRCECRAVPRTYRPDRLAQLIYFGEAGHSHWLPQQACRDGGSECLTQTSDVAFFSQRRPPGPDTFPRTGFSGRRPPSRHLFLAPPVAGDSLDLSS